MASASVKPDRVRLRGGLLKLPLDQVAPDPAQPRKYFDPAALDDLAHSLKVHGQLQPITVAKAGDGYVIIAGERRYQAAKLAGLDTIKALVSDGDRAELALIENLQREDLTPLEEARALEQIRVHKGYTHSQLAKRIGKARSTVTNLLMLNKLHPKIQRQADQLGLQRSLLIEISKMDKKDQLKFYKQYQKDGKLTIRNARRAKAGKRAQGDREARLIGALQRTADQMADLDTPLGTDAYDDALTAWHRIGKQLERLHASV